ncbi:hypothetical protein G4X40_17985 [Rhodococcus sp. D2-41]|uniref:Succinate dehydrogenase n=1 Tax=Speluncibacter jeojiensis TaxID=2710754 RepID=A0A9X4RCF1_9ACTN|nr:hypothetical protein [Rhodococcus sp. D2-41]MDG3012034.1 hypothetical protein [Rhodococcus sp. D2-41]MDG3013489.1 hypothetical protein [Corynebacteriales bacterium D3-21]
MSAPADTAPGGPSPAGAESGVGAPGRAAIAARTLRGDRWWLQPAATFVGLMIFVVYATVRSFVRSAYWVDSYHYLSPFYSPCLSASCAPGSSHLGVHFGTVPMWIPLAFMSLPFLLCFRLTCYYYRKAYYRSFWLSPPACAVAEPHRTYGGESRLPLIVQNAHRYFFYIAVIISGINTYDAVVSFHGSTGGFGFGLGNIIIVANVILLWLYTLSCHSCRHVTGGRLKHFSKHPVRYRVWTWVSVINTRHMMFAWITLYTLILTDLYIMLVASGTISDPRFVN